MIWQPIEDYDEDSELDELGLIFYGHHGDNGLFWRGRDRDAKTTHFCEISLPPHPPKPIKYPCVMQRKAGDNTKSVFFFMAPEWGTEYLLKNKSSGLQSNMHIMRRFEPYNGDHPFWSKINALHEATS